MHDHVHVALHRKDGLWCARRAHVASRNGVGVHPQTLDLHMRYTIGTAGVHSTVHGMQGRKSPVGTTVEDQFRLPCRQPTVTGDAGTEGDHRRVTWIASHQFLGIGHHHLYGPTRVLGQVVTQDAVHQGYIEPHACVVSIEISGKINVWLSDKTPFIARGQFAAALGVPEDRIRVNPVSIGQGNGGQGNGVRLA